MVPRPEEAARLSAEAAGSADGERVVISGMAGLYPQARYIKDLEHILYNKVNPISSDNLRWKFNHPEVAQFTGNVPDLDRFDAQFFKVHYRLGNSMDSMSRKILEQTFEAIYDAGVSPEHLSGKKVGVYVGTCFSETEKACFYVATSRTGFGIAGCSKSMFANRISYWLNAKGPSVSIDEACCSSTAALEAAYKAISHGECEAAVVGGAYLCLHPQSSVHYGRIMNINKDGKTRSFDENADGLCKSEAINVLFLQKAKDAKRVYADVLNVKCDYVSLMQGDIGPRFGFYRNPADTANFLKSFYETAGVPPSEVEYVEAFGSAVPEADKAELEALDKIFCQKRREPLMVGSVMSNIGYGEAASGISAITKVLLAYHKGEIAGNLHCSSPRRDVDALQSGRMRVLSEPERFRRSYTAVNSMSVTGVNAHVLLHGHYKPKDLNRYKSSIPRLVTISGRQESSVNRIFGLLESHPLDPEELALLHNIHETNIAGHLGKGYIILEANSNGETKSLAQRAEYCDGAQRPLWFVYSGMGSQWAGMGAQLLRIPIFAAAIERCHKVLEPRGLDIVHIITSPDKSIFDNILHSFVGIAAIQIGLTDILLALGLVPDKIIGHSVGELGCAYADGCLTAEEMILSAYSRGRVSLETPFIRGSMAAVGMGAQQMAAMCPPEIEIACHNSNESCTISGPADAMRIFVSELTSRGIFAKEVPCSNIAYHSRYIAEAGPGLLRYLREVIKTPRERSDRWVSSSVPRAPWNEPVAKFSSAEYHTNNLLSPVLFEEASSLIPADAVLVEVAPHGLLQAILKRAQPESTANIPLTRRGHADNVVMLLDAIGKLYLHGYNPKVRMLYPEIEFPVSTGTPLLSHFVEWAHQEKWSLPLYQSASRSRAASCKFVMSIHDKEYNYLEGHVINGEIIYFSFVGKISVPFSFALVAVWDTLAMSLDVPRKSIGVEFSDVTLYTQPILHEQKIVRLSVTLQRGSGRFEVMEERSQVATGYISLLKDSIPSNSDVPFRKDVELDSADVYRILSHRGFHYGGEFKSINSSDKSITNANIKWTNNWVTFIDGLFQLNTLKYSGNGIVQPHQIVKMTIDVTKHNETLNSNTDIDSSGLDVELSDVQSKTRSGGILMQNISYRDVVQKKSFQMSLDAYRFVPRFSSLPDVYRSLYVLLQVVAENITIDTIKIILTTSKRDENSELYKGLEKVCAVGIPGKTMQYKEVSSDEEIGREKFRNIDVVIVENLSKNRKMLDQFHEELPAHMFIVNQEENSTTSNVPAKSYNIVSVLTNQRTRLELACWNPIPIASMPSTFTVRTESDLPLLEYSRGSLSENGGLLILSPYPPADGLVNLVTAWRRESARNRVHVIMVKENAKEYVAIEDVPDVNLAFNILDNHVWGGEYYVPLEDTSSLKESVILQSEVVGDLDSLCWVGALPPVGAGNLVSVCYAGLNMSDVRQSLGLSPVHSSSTSNTYGMEFSGMTERGERVMGLVPSGAVSSFVMASPELMWPVPEYWTMEDAATVLLAYILAYYCLVLKPVMRVATKDLVQFTVLIHGGTGALGQAAINIALARGWRVFSTVRDLRKKQFLLKLFPQLNENDIGYSRDSSFCDMILQATKGTGCNIVISCVKEDLKDVSLKCCGSSSTMFDTTQIMSKEFYKLGMNHLTNERSYMAVDIKGIFENLNSIENSKLHDLISLGIMNGEVIPLTRVTFDRDEVPRAFRLLASSNHRGRVLLRVQDEHTLPMAKISSNADSSHLVISDSSSLGVRVVDTLVSMGNKKIHFHCIEDKSGWIGYYQQIWSKKNTNVKISNGCLDNIEDINEVFDRAMELGPLEGVHVVITNGDIQKSVLENINLASKSILLRRFVLLSTDSSNGSYDVCIKRTSKGLPATYLDLSMLNVETNKDHDALDNICMALRRVWQFKEAVVIARKQNSQQKTLIQEIAAIANLNIDNRDGDVSLRDMGLAREKSEIVSTYLRDVHHFCIGHEETSNLTIDRINEIERSGKPAPLPEVKGLDIFFSNIEPDELLATTEIVLLQTLTNSDTSRDDEFDASQRYLCIVPGMEGLAARFRALAERLKLPALVLQPTLDRPADSPRELAARYSKVLQKKCGGVKNNFYLLGYETGVLVALELAAILEEQGLTGTVFCIGDGPEEIQALIKREISSVDSEVLADHMSALLARAGCVAHSAQYTKALQQAAWARMLAVSQPLPAATRLRSRIILLRAQDCVGSDCSLRSYSQQALITAPLTSPLAHAAADLCAPAIINSYLDDELLAIYDEKNLCDTYLMNADTFMTSE